MKRDSFAKRYVIKISSSVIIILLNLVITSLLPRAFSLEEYGYYTFNTSIFTSIVSLADLSTSNALFSKYAKRNNDIGLLKFYFCFFALMALVLNITLTLLFPMQKVASFFGGQPLFVVFLGLETALLNKLYTDVISIYDSIAVTRFPAFIQGLLKVVMSCFVLISYLLGFLHISLFYIGQAVVFCLIIFVLFKEFFIDFKKSHSEVVNYGVKYYAAEFFEFCKPLFIVSIITQILNVFMDSTLLNNFGPEIRAYYGAASQLNSLVVFVFSPFAELSKREFAVKMQNPNELNIFVNRSNKLVMWVTCYFSVFIIFFSDWIIPVIFGNNYLPARNTVIILMVYTIFQSWGQVLGALLYSLEKTKESAFLGYITEVLLFLGIIVFLNPNFLWPQGLGAEGMALTRAVANIGYVFALVLIVSKILKLSAFDMLITIIKDFLFFSILALIIHLSLAVFCDNSIFTSALVFTLVSGIVYTVVTLLFTISNPSVIGFTKDNLKELMNRMKK